MRSRFRSRASQRSAVSSNEITTGGDPSAPMLKIAEQRVSEAGLGKRIALIQGGVDQLPPDVRYDGATCMLVLHFVQSMQRKLELLRGIAKRMKPGAPLLLASLNSEPLPEAFAVQMQACKKPYA